MPDPAAAIEEPDDDRDTILSELAAARGDSGAGASGVADPGNDEGGAAAAGEAGKPDPAAAAGTDGKAKPGGEAAGKPDPETERRQATLQAQEKRQRQALAAEQRKLEERAAELDKRTEKIERLEQLLGGAKDDPAAVLDLLAAAGVTEDRYELVAKDLFAASPEGRKKPELREASQRALRERRYGDELAKTQRELKELRERIEARDAQAESDRRAAATMAGYVKQATSSADKAPLFTELYNRKPEKAEATLAGVAASLIEETGEIPDADDVLATFERLRREELEDLGISVDEFLKKKPPKTERKAAGENTTARTLSNDLSASTKVRQSEAELTEEQERDEILREIAELRRAETG